MFLYVDLCFGGCLFSFFDFSSLWNLVSIFNLIIKGKKSNVSAWFLLCCVFFFLKCTLDVGTRELYSLKIKLNRK